MQIWQIRLLFRLQGNAAIMPHRGCGRLAHTTCACTPKTLKNNGDFVTFSRFDKHFAVLTNCFFRFDIPVSLFSITFAAFLTITKIIMI